MTTNLIINDWVVLSHRHLKDAMAKDFHDATAHIAPSEEWQRY